ncbi:MAG: fumarylacetoacetate hydrolase family protein [Pseudomonadota bacterium]
MHVFPTPRASAIPVVGVAGGEYPIRRIFCVGRNYVAHAEEMGYEVDREKPFYFSKSAFHAKMTGGELPYPQGTENFHFEMELAIALGAEAFRISAEDAPGAIYGHCCALDMTRRDLQLSERNKKRPWTLGKDVEGSAVFSPISRVDDWSIDAQRIWLTQNGEAAQDSTLDLMVWKVPEIVAHLSTFYRLGPGDLIMTGTPEGVGPVAPGDVLKGGIDGLKGISLKIGEPE